MGLFGALKTRRRKAFIERAEALGLSIQLEIGKCVKEALLPRYEAEVALKIAAATANHVCNFGKMNPVHEADPELMSTFAAERHGLLNSFSDTFKTNATGVLILLGAAWRVDLLRFEEHIVCLAKDGFVKTGGDAPDVRSELAEEDRPYFETVFFMNSTMQDCTL